MNEKFKIEDIERAKALYDELRTLQNAITAWHPKESTTKVTVHSRVGSGIPNVTVTVVSEGLQIMRRRERAVATELYRMNVQVPPDAACRYEVSLASINTVESAYGLLLKNTKVSALDASPEVVEAFKAFMASVQDRTKLTDRALCPLFWDSLDVYPLRVTKDDIVRYLSYVDNGLKL